MCRYVVRRDWMSLGVSEIWIMLILKQRLRKCTVGLVHPNQNCIFGKCASSDLEVSTFLRCGEFDAASREDAQYAVRVLRRFNQISEKLSRAARPHRFFAYSIKSLQPLLAIRRGVVQQQKR